MDESKISKIANLTPVVYIFELHKLKTRFVFVKHRQDTWVTQSATCGHISPNQQGSGRAII